MAISGISISPSAISAISQPLSNATASVVNQAKASTPQPSTIVTLSAQAQKLSQTSAAQPGPSQTDNTQSANQTESVSQHNIEAVPKEANEASGIQFMEGETKGGRISTYA